MDITTLPQNARQQACLELSLPEEALVCAAVSRLDPIRGIDDLIIAFDILRHTHDVHLVIIGEGTERQRLESIANNDVLTDKIHWAGFRADVMQILPAFDLFVQPSLHKGMAMTILEAMAEG